MAWNTANGTDWKVDQTGTEWNSTTVQWDSLAVTWDASDNATWQSSANTGYSTANNSLWNNDNIFVDDFVTDGRLSQNGMGWTDAGEAFPDDFSKIRTLNGHAYVEPDVTIPANCDMDIVNLHGGFYSITCGYQDTGLEDIEITTKWRGDPPGIYPGHTVEATPLACITEGSSKFAFGLWASSYLGIGLGLIGWIGKPGTSFSVPYVLYFERNDQPREVKMTVKDYKCRFYIDGIERQAYTNPGLVASDVYIPEELRGSTKHGFALDQHLGHTETTAADWVKLSPYNADEDMSIATTNWYNQNN